MAIDERGGFGFEPEIKMYYLLRPLLCFGRHINVMAPRLSGIENIPNFTSKVKSSFILS